MQKNFRIKAYGDTSYFRASKESAEAVAIEVIQKNGCGYIEQRQPSGLWTLLSRFEPQYGIVAA